MRRITGGGDSVSPTPAIVAHGRRCLSKIRSRQRSIFFDPDADEPVPLSDEKYEGMMIEAMAEVGISSAMIYAFKRTGRIVTEKNKHLLTAQELREWDQAIAEYHRRIESGDVI